MVKVYIVTEESIMGDLIYEEIGEGILTEAKLITNELKEFGQVIELNGMYIMGAKTAFLLENKYKVKALVKELI